MDWDIAGKQVLVTGANSGIGKATAEELARRGAKVMITARNRGRGEAAVADIQRATGAEVELGMVDFADLASVREFAATFTGTHDRLDVLVNNAGAMAGSRQLTADGVEWTFGVNHLGPFLLTNLLNDLLVASAPSRIVNVASDAHRSAKDGLDLDDVRTGGGRYSAQRAYGASKLANILFTVELQHRLEDTGVSADALHPGVVATGFGKGDEAPWWMGVAMRVLKPVLRKPARGAETSVFLATAPAEALDAGLYWADSAPKDPIPAALDEEAARRLWAVSEELAGLAA